MRGPFVRIFVMSIASLAWIDCARAIGWDSDDFIISGGPSFTTTIGIYDHDFTFKGFLDNNFVIVGGMSFDASGRLVAAGGGNARAVRVYESSGTQVGGFTNGTLLSSATNLKVTSAGNYVVGLGNSGGPPDAVSAREFTPEGALVHEYRSGGGSGVAVLPGNRLWTGRAGSMGVDVFDLTTGANLGQIPIAGLNGVSSMFYSASTDTVLIATFLSNGVIEAKRDGTVVRTFSNPIPTNLIDVTRGPNGDVFATRGQRVFRWDASGTFLGEISPPPTDLSFSSIVWAGNAPEPAGCLLWGFACITAAARRRRRRR